MLSNAISKIRLILEDTQRDLPMELTVVIEGVYEEINNLNNYINGKSGLIDKDGDLNARAKRRAKRMMLEQAARRLELLKDKRNYPSMPEELNTKLPVEPVKEDPVLKFLREKEIRDRLYGMTERQVKSYFGNSLFDGSNPLLVDAILKAPTGFEVLAEEDLEQLRQLRASKKKSTENTSQIGHIRKMHSCMSQIFNLIKKELDALRKNEFPDDFISKTFQLEFE